MSLKYLAAYALVALNNDAPSKDQVSKVVASSGVKVDNAELDYVFEALKGKSVSDLIAEGSKKMASAAPAGGAAAPAAAADAPAKGAAPAAKKKATPPPSDDDDDMIGGLF